MCQMQGALLSGAGLQGAHFLETRLQGATCRECEDSHVPRALELIGQESELSNVQFTGGLTHADVVSLVGGLSREKATVLAHELKPHTDVAESHVAAEGTVLGTFTREQAEGWVRK